jgi:hypothetical protein
MSRATLDEAFGLVIEETAKKVAQLGFRRRGSILRVVSQGNAGLIDFQKSTMSSAERILFTINLAVVCGALLEPDRNSVEKARSPDAHVRQRIGFLMPGCPDKWWELAERTDASGLAAEVSELVVAEGAPFVVRYLDTREIVALWESGKSPGMTETQRVRYLGQLKSKR